MHCAIKVRLTDCLAETRRRILELIHQKVAALKTGDVAALRSIEAEQLKARNDHDNVTAILDYHVAEHGC